MSCRCICILCVKSLPLNYCIRPLKDLADKKLFFCVGHFYSDFFMRNLNQDKTKYIKMIFMSQFSKKHFLKSF